MKLSTIRQDPDAAQEGVWVEFEGGARLLVARMPNPAYERAMRRLGRPYRREFRAARFQPEKLEGNPELIRVQKQAVAETVLLGWEGIENEDGSPLPYTPEKGLELFLDPAYDILWRFVVDVASEAGLYHAEDRTDAEGNSSQP